ncbi:MAG: hypothetical protein CM1200mP18_12330 [Gammaproteobacteria bacterium]|nr:MAG: hypothetical protein CM1200mP18_12330 [Gammaproteobacteria bacterium]
MGTKVEVCDSTTIAGPVRLPPGLESAPVIGLRHCMAVCFSVEYLAFPNSNSPGRGVVRFFSKEGFVLQLRLLVPRSVPRSLRWVVSV